MEQRRIQSDVVLQVQIFESATESFTIGKAPPPQIPILNILKQPPNSVKLGNHGSVVVPLNMNFAPEIIKSNGGSAPIHVQNASHVVSSGNSDCGLVMVQNDDVGDLGRDLPDKARGAHKVKEVEVADIVKGEALGCDGAVNGVGEEESFNGFG